MVSTSTQRLVTANTTVLAPGLLVTDSKTLECPKGQVSFVCLWDNLRLEASRASGWVRKTKVWLEDWNFQPHPPDLLGMGDVLAIELITNIQRFNQSCRRNETLVITLEPPGSESFWVDEHIEGLRAWYTQRRHGSSVPCFVGLSHLDVPERHSV